jgi:heterodisulfide reductase subunit B
MKFALFSGCVIPQKENAYELSTKRVAKNLDIELVDLPEANCCGYFLSFIDRFSSTVLASRNLVLAEELGCDLLTLCNGCFGHLTRVNHELQTNTQLRKKVNSNLQAAGKKFQGKVQVKHFAQVLARDIGVAKIKETIIKPLNHLRVTPHWGCHIVRPSKKVKFDDPEDTKILDALIEATGAQLIDVIDKKMCCGGPISAIDEKTSFQILMNKLQHIDRANVSAIATVCPFCHIQFDLNQLVLQDDYNSTYQIPVLHYPQLLGLAQGISPDELGFDENRIPVDDILETL